MKPTKIRVKPARPGMKLVHPVSGILPDEGKRWIDDSFTRRRVADGGITIVVDDVAADASDDVEPVPVPAPAAPVAAKPATAEK